MRNVGSSSGRLLGIVVVGAVLAGCGGVGQRLAGGRVPVPSPTPAARLSPRPRFSRVVGLGDSVPAAAACGCRSFVAQLGDQLAHAQRTAVTVDNEAADGLTSDGLRQQVVAQGIAARPAQVTVITIGANDFDASVLSGPGCTAAADVGCYQPTLTAMGAHLDALLTALAAAPGPHGPTLVTGYWNVFLDGAVGAAQGTAYVRDSDALTRAVNAVLQARATQDAATYVDLYTPFKGDGDRDDTGLLAADGDHPSAAGHALIARVLRQALTASA